MASSGSRPQGTDASHAGEDVSRVVFGEGLSFGDLPVGPLATENVQAFARQFFGEDDLTAAAAAAAPETPMPPLGLAQAEPLANSVPELPTGTSQRSSENKRPEKFKYSKMKVMANSAVYILPDYREACLGLDREIVGQIKECARVSNGNMYRVQWKKGAGPESYPSDLNPSWLREYFPKEEEGSLREMIGRYEEMHPEVVNIDGAPVRTARTLAGTPPAVLRGRAVAAMRTSSTGSPGSRRSVTDTGSERLQRRNLHRGGGFTRNHFDSGIPSDVEDGNDLDEEDSFTMGVGETTLDSETEDEEDPVDQSPGDDSDSDKDCDDEVEEAIAGSIREMIDALQFKMDSVPAGDETVRDEEQP